MATKKTTANNAKRATMWDPVLGKGKQHTIYAPAAFFELWAQDSSPLKKLVNDFLVKQAKPVTPVSIDEI